MAGVDRRADRDLLDVVEVEELVAARDLDRTLPLFVKTLTVSPATGGGTTGCGGLPPNSKAPMSQAPTAVA